MSELDKLFKNLAIKEEINPYFIISTIARVPDIENNNFDCDSSDEEIDGSLYDENDFKSPPFSIQKTIKKQSFHDVTKNCNNTTYKPKVIDPFLKQLSEEAFENFQNMETKKKQIVVSLALNKMLSVSSRRNCSLRFELNTNSESIFQYVKFGFFWECQWYSTKNEKKQKVDYKTVRKFYKQLKRYDFGKAEEFLEKESNILVPYQDLREYAKNHPKTKLLIKYLRREYNANIIYFTLMDSDTFNFNGVFSAYIRIVHNYYEKHKKLPTIMSTGYEYSSNVEPCSHMYNIATKIDRKIRIVTSKHLPMCVYYPEPNMCVLIPVNDATLPESFINRSRVNGNLESPCLIKNMINNNLRQLNFVFSDDKPLITNAPERVGFNKAKPKTKLQFSGECEKGYSPTKQDLQKTNQVSQCNQHGKVWYNNVFINGGIQFINKLENYVNDTDLETCQSLLNTVKRSNDTFRRNEAIEKLKMFNINNDVLKSLTIPKTWNHCIHLLSQIRNAKTEMDVEEASNELKFYVDSKIVIKIIEVIADLQEAISESEMQYARSEDESELIKIINEANIDLSLFSRTKILILSQADVIKLLKEKLINLNYLVNVNEEIFKIIFYEERIVNALLNKSLHIRDILRLFTQAPYTINEIVEFHLEDILNKLEAGKYPSKDIINCFLDNPLIYISNF